MTKDDQTALLDSVVHELRAPLNACLMAVSLLELKAGEPDAVRSSAEVIRRNLERQAMLIRDLADVVQVVSGDLPIRRERISVEELLDGAVASAAAAAMERGVVLERGPAAGAAVETDGERASQVLHTLLDNLLAGAARGARIRLQALERGGCIEISAGDLGGPAAGGPGVAGGASAGAPARPSGARPAREHKGFALRLLLAETLLERLDGAVERNAGGFSLRLPPAAPA